MAKRPSGNRKSAAARGSAARATMTTRRRRPKRKAAWPFVLVMLLAWGAIFGAIFYSHFLSDLPDVKNLLASGPVARRHHPG